jgi:hypothetical protein
MIDDSHKVDLTAPDKTIIVEIYQVRSFLLFLNPTTSTAGYAMIRCINVFSFTNTVFVDGVWYECSRERLGPA